MHKHNKIKLDELLNDYPKSQSKILLFMESLGIQANSETLTVRQQKGKIEMLSADWERHLKAEKDYLAEVEINHKDTLEDLEYAKVQLGMISTTTKKVVECLYCHRKFDELKGKVCPHCGKDNNTAPQNVKPLPSPLPTNENTKNLIAKISGKKKKVTRLIEEEVDDPSPEGK